MEAIKVEVSVNLTLSNDAKEFIANLVSSALTSSSVQTAKPEAAEPEATKPEAAKPEVTVTIEDVRKALASKVNEHRSEIKDKLAEFGAPSVTKLDPANYKAMLDYLNSL